MLGCVGYKHQPVNSYDGLSRVYIVIGASNALLYRHEPVLSFIIEMEAKSGDTIYVLNCAKPKSGLKDWKKGSTYYNQCMSLYTSEYSTLGTLEGIIFINGEYESLYGTEWYTPFIQLVESLKTDFNNPDLKISFVEAHLKWIGRHTAQLRLQQENSQLYLGACMVNADDTLLSPDRIHYTKAALTTIGQRLATCY